MDSKNRTRANLKKYIKVAGEWRFVPVLKRKRLPGAGHRSRRSMQAPQGLNTQSALRPTCARPHRTLDPRISASLA